MRRLMFGVVYLVTLIVGMGRLPADDEMDLKDIGTRSRGIDWPFFLGPNGDSKSPETGILKEWPKEGPKIVWQRELGISYGIGSVSKGRYYQFDRIGDRATLFCLNAETGKELWSGSGFGLGVYSIAFRGDGKTIAGASYNNQVKIWNAADGKELRTLTRVPKPMPGAGLPGLVSVTYSSDGRFLAAAGGTPTITVWTLKK